MKFQPVIKWSGSKRSQSEEIIKRFPKKIDTYYEPFIGGGSILFQLLNSDIEVKEYICSDINEELIALWNIIKEEPYELYKDYLEKWTQLNSIEDIEKKKEYYYEIRNKFNKSRNPKDFMFLSRTCVNGLIRYNKKGEFNTSLHSGRPGIHPEKLKKIIYQWSDLLNEKNVKFIQQDYRCVNTSENDLIYLDPPYANTTGMYYGTINYEQLWKFLIEQKGNYILSFDGKTNVGNTEYDVPNEIYDKHEYIYYGISGFHKLHKKQIYVEESLYIKIKSIE